MILKKFKDFKESLTVKPNELSNISNFVDKLEWKDGEKIAFVDYNGIKDIPIYIEDHIDENELELN